MLVANLLEYKAAEPGTCVGQMQAKRVAGLQQDGHTDVGAGEHDRGPDALGQRKELLHVARRELAPEHGQEEDLRLLRPDRAADAAFAQGLSVDRAASHACPRRTALGPSRAAHGAGAAARVAEGAVPALPGLRGTSASSSRHTARRPAHCASGSHGGKEKKSE